VNIHIHLNAAFGRSSQFFAVCARIPGIARQLPDEVGCMVCALLPPTFFPWGQKKHLTCVNLSADCAAASSLMRLKVVTLVLLEFLDS